MEHNRDNVYTHYGCKYGFVSIMQNSFGGFTPIGFGAGGNYLGMRKAVDGSLIIVKIDSWAALILVVPLWCHDNIWYRFPIANEQ